MLFPPSHHRCWFYRLQEKSRAAVAIARRREITLLGNKIFHDAIGAKKNLFIDILFYLCWLWFIFSTLHPRIASIHLTEMNFITGIFNEVGCEGMNFVCRFLIQGLKFESFFRLNWFSVRWMAFDGGFKRHFFVIFNFMKYKVKFWTLKSVNLI